MEFSDKLRQLYRDQEVLAAFLKSVAPAAMPAGEWAEVERQANQHMISDGQDDPNSSEDDGDGSDRESASYDQGAGGRPAAKQRKVSAR